MREIIIPAIILILIALSTSCMRKAAEELEGKIVEKAVESAEETVTDDIDIDLPDGDKGIDLPDGYPEDSIPVYQKDDALRIVAARTRDDGEISYVLTYQAPGEPREAYEFYRDLPGQSDQELIEMGTMFTVVSKIAGYEMNVAVMDISDSSEAMKSGITLGITAPAE